MKLVIPWLCMIGLFASVSLGQDPPTETLEKSLSQLLSKARLLHAKILRAPDPQKCQKILAEGSVELRDWLQGQRWSFTGSVVSITEDNGQYFINLDTPVELVRYTRNDGAYLSGGIVAQRMKLPLAIGHENSFTAGNSVELVGTVVSRFGNDVPVRKPEHGSNALLDIIIPPLNKHAPVRIELALEEISTDGHADRLAAPVANPAVPAQPKIQPPIEAALLLIQKIIEQCAIEAQRQKNTALVSELLDATRTKISESLDGKQWSFTVTAVDVISANDEYYVNTRCHSSLAKFLDNQEARSRGGIWSNSLRIAIDRTLAESIGRGDSVTISGTVQVHHEPAGYNNRRQDLLLFQLFLPPLDGVSPLPMTFSLLDAQVTK